MRIWDLSAGYLNRQSLLGEHRELHGIHAILIHGKRGYARHPETLRWAGALEGLVRRHDLLAAEMRLRGYVDRSPLERPQATGDVGAGGRSGARRPSAVERGGWPTVFVTEPWEQIALLRRKYLGREKGRLALPRSAQQVWAQHNYSVMARSPDASRRLGRVVAGAASRRQWSGLLAELIGILRDVPDPRRLENAIAHMWGHVRRHATADEKRHASNGAAAMLATTQVLALRIRERYLLGSTALSELATFLPVPHR